MPYITEQTRNKFIPVKVPFKTLDNLQNLSAGEINYIITWLLIRQAGPSPNYKRFNELIGALECCKLELYRRIISPYEDKKIIENGDVYPIE